MVHFLPIGAGLIIVDDNNGADGLDGWLDIFGKDLFEWGLLVGLEDDFKDDDLVVFGADDEEARCSFVGVLVDFVVF